VGNDGRTSSLDVIYHSEDARHLLDVYEYPGFSYSIHQKGAPHNMTVNTNLTLNQFSMPPKVNQKSSSLMNPTKSHDNKEIPLLFKN
jgi:hypothetical protein